MSLQLSQFTKSLTVETAFTVLAVAKALKAKGKDVVELEIGDSPFDSTASAKLSGTQAIANNQSHYCPSPGLPEFRDAAAKFVREEFGIPAEAKNIVVGPGAKVFEQFFCEAFLDPNDGVLVFSPYFPTYTPNILRRGARAVFKPLKQSNGFRPAIADIEADEPYCHMVWKGKHHSLLAQPGMMEQCVAAYTFSKSYSMSGWRLGFAVSSAEIVDSISKMINTTLSCTPPIVQLAGKAALERDSAERDAVMAKFREKVVLLTNGLNQIDGFKTLDPTATFYVFPNVAPICNRLGIKSHGLALYLLEGADDNFGVACLGGECFGEAGGGFLRFSCAEPNDRLQQAVDFIPVALSRTDRIAAYLETHPQFRLTTPYVVEG
ncbi:MAG: aminotransferase [Planctomycetota bacterium]|nr:MAG: aminotransferase [Planctomycetota bacterium]